MKELTVENKKEKFNSQSLVVFFISIILMICGNIQILIGIFPYIFKKNALEKLIYIITSILLFVLYPKVFVYHTIYISIYFLISYFIRKNRKDISMIKYYVGIYTFIISFLMSDNLILSINLLVIQIIYYEESINSHETIHNIPTSVYALIIISLMTLALQYMNVYNNIFITIGYIFICFNCNPLISLTSLFLINIYMPILSLEVYICILLISLCKKQVSLMILIYLGFFATQTNNLYELLILGLYLVFFLLLSKSDYIVSDKKIVESNMKLSIHKQLIHFSLIFDHLSTYYENISTVESNFLKTMSNALQYTSKKNIQNEQSIDYVKNQVISIFEGYDIGYEDLEIEMDENGIIKIECSLMDFSKEEVKEVILPLFNHILPTEMDCISYHKPWFNFGIAHVEFESTPPIQIDAYADSTQIGTTCGDSFSVFQHSIKNYCLISDGMGSGLEASKISKCIVHLFQRMIFSNINEIEAVNCINKLLLSDDYATCDILIFNRFRKIVTICKSAANPTYLIRNNELFAIWGNSLPIGIVAHIDVENVHVHVQKGDLFIMSSDGVSIDEILLWMKKSEGLNARLEVERIMKILNQKEREDDSTILLAKVI